MTNKYPNLKSNLDFSIQNEIETLLQINLFFKVKKRKLSSKDD